MLCDVIEGQFLEYAFEVGARELLSGLTIYLGCLLARVPHLNLECPELPATIPVEIPKRVATAIRVEMEADLPPQPLEHGVRVLRPPRPNVLRAARLPPPRVQNRQGLDIQVDRPLSLGSRSVTPSEVGTQGQRRGILLATTFYGTPELFFKLMFAAPPDLSLFFDIWVGPLPHFEVTCYSSRIRSLSILFSRLSSCS